MSISTRHVSIFKWLKLVLFTKYVFYKSALPSDTLSVGRKLLWKYRNIVPRLVICLLPDGRICKLVWSSPEVQQFSQPTIISNCSRDCRQPQNLGGSKIFWGDQSVWFYANLFGKTTIKAQNDYIIQKFGIQTDCGIHCCINKAPTNQSDLTKLLTRHLQAFSWYRCSRTITLFSTCKRT